MRLARPSRMLKKSSASLIDRSSPGGSRLPAPKTRRFWGLPARFARWGSASNFVFQPAHLVDDTRGSHLVEYLILVGVIALLSIPAFTQFGKNVGKAVKQQGTLVEGLLPKMGF
jgi:Flp pilus assembly pilin Flp